MTAADPEDRRPQQPLHEPGDEMLTHTLDGDQRWRQYGWIDHLGRMYDLGEDPSSYRVASFAPLWVLVDNDRPESSDEDPS